MIARFHLVLPFSLAVPEGEQFDIRAYEDDGFTVQIYPPIRSGDLAPTGNLDEMRINGVPGFYADVLRIDFHKSSFDRRKETHLDPPEPVISRAINSFLTRVRYVGRASQIRLLAFPWGTYGIEYLNDDESTPVREEGAVRVRGAKQFQFQATALTKKVWNDIHEIPPDFEPPPWEDLLIDAHGELPRIGPAIVLAATALEVFISRKLDELASAGKAPATLWSWINKREDYRREPTVEEQYDVLLKALASHSLKESPKLWDAFIALKKARNAFVHEGRAILNGKPLTLGEAQRLVSAAEEIITQIRQWLPSELHWPVFRHQVEFTFGKKLFSPNPTVPSQLTPQAKSQGSDATVEGQE